MLKYDTLNQKSALYNSGTYQDYIYYDLDILNNDTTGLNAPVRLVFQETRTTPFITDPSIYDFSVIRFSMDTPSLPVFVPQVQIGQPDINKTIYSVSMSYVVGGNTINYQQFIDWIPQDLSQPIPAPPTVLQDLNSQYYFCYNHSHWVRCINNAITLCFNGLSAAVVAAGGALPTTKVPFMNYLSPSSLTELYFDKTGFDSALTNPIKFYMNTPLQTLLSSYDFNYLGYQNITNGKNYQLNIYSVNGLNEVIIGPVGSTYTAIKMSQEYVTTQLWNPVQNLVFTTSILPIAPSLVSTPKIWNSYATVLSAGSNNNFSPVITDLEVAMTNGNDYKPNVLYNPTAEYRMVSLLSKNPITSIEISVYWRTSFGNLVPFYLNSGCSGSIKLLFRKKNIPIDK